MRITHAAKVLMFYIGIFAIIRKLTPNPRAAILRYHAIVDNDDNDYANPSICLSKKSFERHVKYFSQKYNVVSLDTVIKTLQDGKPLPVNAVVFTFDDGYADNFIAAQILKKYRATGTFYLTAACIDRREPFWLSEVIYCVLHTQKSSLVIQAAQGEEINFNLINTNKSKRWQITEKLIGIIKSNNRRVREEIRQQIREQLDDVRFAEVADKIMLTWEQVRRMHDNGMTIGGHTMTHLNLPNAGRKDAEAEILDCKKLLEEKLDCEVIHFSYPNSGPYKYYSGEIRNIVERSGYLSSATSYAGFAGKDCDPFALKRVRTIPSLVETVAGIELDRVLK
ncbi:MAG: polysaccharide deacetylase family protein [bacterium]